MPDLNRWPTPRLLSTAARLVEYAWNEKLASLNLTHAGAIALEVLETAGPLAQVQLASIVRVQSQTMGKTLTRLELHGHITRIRNGADRRARQIAISQLGRQALAQARKLELDLLRGSGTELEELRERLRLIIRQLESADLETNTSAGLRGLSMQAEPRRPEPE